MIHMLKGKGEKKTLVIDELYSCTLCKGKPFIRKASKLQGLTTALCAYIKQNHGKIKALLESRPITTLIKWMSEDKTSNNPSFKEALID
jgi:hypothetical protein